MSTSIPSSNQSSIHEFTIQGDLEKMDQSDGKFEVKGKIIWNGKEHEVSFVFNSKIEDKNLKEAFNQCTETLLKVAKLIKETTPLDKNEFITIQHKTEEQTVIHEIGEKKEVYSAKTIEEKQKEFEKLIKTGDKDKDTIEKIEKFLTTAKKIKGSLSTFFGSVTFKDLDQLKSLTKQYNSVNDFSIDFNNHKSDLDKIKKIKTILEKFNEKQEEHQLKIQLINEINNQIGTLTSLKDEKTPEESDLKVKAELLFWNTLRKEIKNSKATEESLTTTLRNKNNPHMVNSFIIKIINKTDINELDEEIKKHLTDIATKQLQNSKSIEDLLLMIKTIEVDNEKFIIQKTRGLGSCGLDALLGNYDKDNNELSCDAESARNLFCTWIISNKNVKEQLMRSLLQTLKDNDKQAKHYLNDSTFQTAMNSLGGIDKLNTAEFTNFLNSNALLNAYLNVLKQPTTFLTDIELGFAGICFNKQTYLISRIKDGKIQKTNLNWVADLLEIKIDPHPNYKDLQQVYIYHDYFMGDHYSRAIILS